MGLALAQGGVWHCELGVWRTYGWLAANGELVKPRNPQPVEGLRLLPWPRGGIVACAMMSVCAGSAFAVPRDSMTWESVESQGLLNTSANQLRLMDVLGTYIATRVNVSGVLAEVSLETWASDARIVATSPLDVRTTIQPFETQSFDGTLLVEKPFIDLGLPLGPAAGRWRFRFFEEFVDASVGPDAMWTTVTLSIDDTSAAAGWFESIDAGELPWTAQQAEGTGSFVRIGGRVIGAEADVYLIEICDAANFSATTEGHASWDTQLYLFREDGVGVAFNDDSPVAGGLQSRLSHQFVTGNGRYLLGISEFNRKPETDSGLAMWQQNPSQVERAPDGPGAGGILANWDAPSNGAGGFYEIRLTGACLIPGVVVCRADLDDGTGLGNRDGSVNIDDLLFFLWAFELGDARVDLDNGSGMGFGDGAVEISDLLYFLVRFEAGC